MVRSAAAQLRGAGINEPLERLLPTAGTGNSPKITGSGAIVGEIPLAS
jgi:hypothetical protein